MLLSKHTRNTLPQCTCSYHGSTLVLVLVYCWFTLVHMCVYVCMYIHTYICIYMRVWTYLLNQEDNGFILFFLFFSCFYNSMTIFACLFSIATIFIGYVGLLYSNNMCHHWRILRSRHERNVIPWQACGVPSVKVINHICQPIHT